VEVDTSVSTGRDRFVDFVRAGSLVVVVVWHWAFTVFDWRDDGPHATNPIGFTSGLWLLTWGFQVMPLFFFVGGWANLQGWTRAVANGVGMRTFLAGRIRGLALPALALIAVWWTIAVVVAAVYDVDWIGRAAILVCSPLWFAATYLLIVALLPVWLRLHRRFGPLVPVWLMGIATLVDVARFSHDWPWIGWINMVVVWGLAHQLGFSYDRFAAAPRQYQWAMMWTGLFALMALVWSRLYPASMVGVPGDKFSNMAPPSLAIVALVVFQIGAQMLVRPWILVRLQRPRWQRVSGVLNEYALPLYLLHSTGMAIALFLFYLLTDRRADQIEISPLWWLTRPAAIAVPLLTTLPLLWMYGRLSRGRVPAG
jgi:Acyltransferase family